MDRHRGRRPGPPRGGRGRNNNEQNRNSTAPNSNGTDEGQSSGSSAPPRKWDGPIFGFKRLYGFLETSQDDVIMAIERNTKDWEKLLDSEELCKPNSDDLLVLITHIMGEKVCSSDCNVPRQQSSVLSRSLRLNYIEKLKDKLHKICMGTDGGNQARRHNAMNLFQVDCSYSRLLNNVHIFYNCVAQKMPNTAADLLQTSIPISIVAVCNMDNIDPVEQVELKEKFNKLIQLYKTLVEKKENEQKLHERRRKFGPTKQEDDELHEMTAPDDFREIPITPNIEEILSTEEPFLRTNKESGAYHNADHYLDVQFRLLREDFVRPLKKGVQDFMKNRHDYLIEKKRMPLGTVRIYTDVEIIRAELVKETFIYNIQLSENDYKRIKWNKSKRLLVGSLLVFTCDMFKTAYFATVAIRNDAKIQKGILGIKWEGPQPTWDRRQEFLMVECEVYFEAYRHTLQILKTIELERFPMYSFIVESSFDVKAPEYLRNANSLLKLRSIDGEDAYLSPLVDSQWLTSTELGLDAKQYEAFKAALTKEFAIIQGPPGTGKTFIGLKVTEVLLNNLNIWKAADTGPILVVCYTNHALDQFMEGILTVFEKNDITPSMIRVGGRSQSEILDSYSLARQRRLSRNNLGKGYYASKSAALREVRILQNDRAELMTELMGLNDLKGIVDFRGLKVWSTLSTEFPKVIWDSFLNIQWFGITDIIFYLNFSPDKMLNEWFKILPSKKVTANQKTVSHSSKRKERTDTKEEESDEEDYDLDELMANRMIEDVYAEAETTAPKNVGHHLSYHSDFSIQNIERQRESLHNNIAIMEKTEKNPASRKANLQGYQQQLQILNNKQIFIDKMFGLYCQGLLEVNNVDEIVAQAKTTPNFNCFTLSRINKWSLFFHIVERAKTLTVQSINDLERDLIEEEQRLQEILKYGDGQLLLQTQVVGMTTTGAAKYNDLLKIMKSRIGMVIIFKINDF